MISRRLPSLFVVAAVVSACGGGPPEWAGSITDSAGVQIVANAGEGLWAEEARWTTVEELRIGTMEGEPEYQFGQIGWLDAGSDGRIYVFDTQGQHVKVFSAAGEYERTIGGPGGGPGEIGEPRGAQAFIMVGAGDTLLVPDIQNQRVNRYTADGGDAGSYPVNLTAGFPMSWQAAPQGGMAEQVRQIFSGGDDPSAEQRDVVILRALDGTVTDTLTSFPSGNTIRLTDGGLPEWTIYSPEPAWTITEGGHLLTGVSDEYRLRAYDGNGALVRVITMPFEQRVVSDRDQSLVLDFFEELFEEQGAPAAFIPQLMANVHFAEHLPAFGRIVTGPDGTIWVQHIRAASDMTDEQLKNANFLEDIGAPNWDVLDRGGRYLGVVTMPDRFAPRIIVGRKIYGVWRDEFDVQYAVRLRIEGGDID